MRTFAKYCSNCGIKLVKINKPIRYSSQTGKPEYLIKCPNSIAPTIGYHTSEIITENELKKL